MSLTQILASQLVDPFRIALIIGLFMTMLRTQAATGVWVPLAAGALFVAVIIPVTLNQGDVTVPVPTAVGVGLVANVILIGIVMAGVSLYQKLRDRG